MKTRLEKMARDLIRLSLVENFTEDQLREVTIAFLDNEAIILEALRDA